MKQRSSKSLQTNFLWYSNAKSTLKVPPTSNKVEKTKLENFNFVHFCFFLARRNSKTIQSWWILNIPNDCLANLLHSYLFWASCKVWVASYGLKTVPKSLHIVVRTLLGFSDKNCVGVAHTVRPHLDYWVRAVQAVRGVRRSSFIVFSINLV